MKYILAFAILLSPVVSYALVTGQAADIIFYEGQKRALYSNPLEDYYRDDRKRPNFMIDPNTVSSGNWRGYIATWEIKDNTLYMTKIESWIGLRKVTLELLLCGKCWYGRVEITWFVEDLKIRDGKQIQYVHMGYGSVYERDIILTVEAGKITKTVTIDNTKRQLPS